jgi:hypothetical protein
MVPTSLIHTIFSWSISLCCLPLYWHLDTWGWCCEVVVNLIIPDRVYDAFYQSLRVPRALDKITLASMEDRTLLGSNPLGSSNTAPSRCRRQVQWAWRPRVSRPAPSTCLWPQCDKSRGVGGRATKTPDSCLFVQ